MIKYLILILFLNYFSSFIGYFNYIKDLNIFILMIMLFKSTNNKQISLKSLLYGTSFMYFWGLILFWITKSIGLPYKDEILLIVCLLTSYWYYSRNRKFSTGYLSNNNRMYILGNKSNDNIKDFHKKNFLVHYSVYYNGYIYKFKKGIFIKIKSDNNKYSLKEITNNKDKIINSMENMLGKKWRPYRNCFISIYLKIIFLGGLK